MVFFFLESVERKKSKNIRENETYTKLFDYVVYQAISWYKLPNIFTSYNYTLFIYLIHGLLGRSFVNIIDIASLL